MVDGIKRKKNEISLLNNISHENDIIGRILNCPVTVEKCGVFQSFISVRVNLLMSNKQEN